MQKASDPIRNQNTDFKSDWKKRLFLANRSFHRDVGYFCVGLILIYAISGIAVNHIDSWNPSYVVTRLKQPIESLPAEPESKEFELALIKYLKIKTPLLSSLKESDNEYLFFFEGTRVLWNTTNQQAEIEKVEKRTGLFFVNYLHLNKAKKAWTYVADAFAILLIYLSISGLFMVKGSNGFARRGWLLVASGFIVPLAFYYLYI